jgi:hypothetical protein
MTQVTKNKQEDQLSYYIQTTNRFGQPVNIPVIDVRDGLAERLLGEQFIKSSNRSKYMSYNEYHISRKQTNQ